MEYDNNQLDEYFEASDEYLKALFELHMLDIKDGGRGVDYIRKILEERTSISE